MHFPINHFSTIVRPPPSTARCILSLTDIAYFISASAAVDRRFNAASKKENNTERMSINFLISNVSRGSRPKVFCKKGVLRNFAKFTGKHLRQSLFFNEVAGMRPAILLKKTLSHRCFPVNFAKFLEHLFPKKSSGGCFFVS